MKKWRAGARTQENDKPIEHLPRDPLYVQVLPENKRYELSEDVIALN